MADIRAFQAFVQAVVTNPASAAVRATQAFVQVVTRADPTVRVSQAFIQAVVRGRVADPKVRVWTYTLDGHDYYVINLGEVETLVWDAYSKQWSVFGNADTPLWAAKTGINWVDSGTYPAGYGSNVLAGDRESGTLYFLDPEYPYDEDPITGETDRLPFMRVAQAQAIITGFQREPCFSVQLAGSHGDVFSASFTDVTLSYSDDAGRTYTDAGTITVALTDYAARVEWCSLGSMAAPGRLFKITDYGAYQRINGLEMNGNSEPE